MLPFMEPETQHMLQVLKTIMRVLGYTNRDIERKLGLSSSYLSRLFSGGMELRFEHIVQISRAMGLTLEEVFQFAYPQPKEPPSEALVRLRLLAGGFQPAPAPPDPPPIPSFREEEIERLTAKALRKFFGDLAKTGDG
jgi:transcriptional regulator with XRE-family HTH domain